MVTFAGSSQILALPDNAVVIVDAPTATALAQILPVLLLTLTVELRRTSIHRRSTLHLILLGLFFIAFDVVETVLVLSIDGTFYPTRSSDLLSALTIFGLLVAIFRLSFVDSSGPDRT